MLRMREIRDAKAAGSYYGKTDGGTYYLDAPDLRREVGGKAAAMLGLASMPDADQFKRLLQGLHPETGEQLTAKLVDNRICGWDVTASIPKGVTIALERGDTRIHDALWAAGREAMADIEAFATTRERQGGKQDNRTTGNMMWFGYEHPETRPAKSDGMPDPDRHIHFVIPNLTYDADEDQWKALKFRPVMELRKYFDRRFDMRLASKLADLGYGIESKYKSTDEGKRYYSWDIAGLPKTLVDKFSRRTGEVETLAAELGITGQSKDKLGATSRQFKRTDMTLADYRKYWDSRVSPEEAQDVAEVIQAAMMGLNAPQENTADKAVAYAIGHCFERQSVVKWHDLAIVAMERSMGGAKPEEIEPEAVRQGALLKNGEATTRGVLAEEARIIAYARDGRGTCQALGAETRLGESPNNTRILAGMHSDTATLSPEQQAVSSSRSNQAVSPSISSKLNATEPVLNLSAEQAVMVNHVLTSPDRVMLVVGDAGVGKTFAVKSAFARIDRPVEILAPGAEASRGVLRRDGFSTADTVTAFLNSERRQQGVKGGVIWVDEAGQLPIRDLSQLVDISRNMNARLVLQGDPKQHRSVARDGNMLRVLEQYAGLPVARLTDIRRQRGDYKAAVSLLSKGEMAEGFSAIEKLGWVQTVEGNAPLVDDFVAALDAKKEVLAVAPTHAEADEVTDAIRARLKLRGAVTGDEHVYDTLRPLHWSEAERGDLERYDGSEVIRFHRDSGTFKAGQRIAIADFKPGMRLGPATTYSVFSPTTTALAKGDSLRITANGKSCDGKHALDNGSRYTVAGFEKDGKIRLTNGWFLAPDFMHFTHGFVTTSHASQGRTVDRVLIAMGQESLGAINAEQFYVSVSRGRESAKVYTDVPPHALRLAVQKADARKSATEFWQPKQPTKRRSRIHSLVQRARAAWENLRQRNGAGMPEKAKQREYGYGGR